MDTGFTWSGFPVRGRRSCLVAVMHPDVETDIGFGIERAGAHVSSHVGNRHVIY